MIPGPSPRAGPTLVHFMHSLEVGGLERVVLDLASRARAQGLDHRLILCDRPFTPGSDLDPGEIPCAFIPRGKGLDLRFVRRLRRYFSDIAVDIVHAHNDTPICYAALAGLPRTKTTPSLVGTFHTLPSHGGRAARMLTKWSTARASAVTAVSRDLGERLETMGWSRPLQVIPNGVQLDLFRPRTGAETRGAWREKAAIPSDAFLIGCFARFVTGKRHEDLIEAARIMRRGGGRVFLLLAGQGPLRNDLSERLRDDADTRVMDPIDDVPDALRDLDALVLCSDHEAHPRIVLEALATGVPCVLTNVGGMPEMVGSADPGAILVPARDPPALADALRSLASDEDLRTKIGAAARKRAQHYSFELQWTAYRDLWNDVIRRRGADSAGASGSASAARSGSSGT